MRKHCFEKRHGGNYQGNTASVGKVLFSSISFLPLWAPIVKALLLWVVLYQKRVTIRSTCVCPADCKPKLTVHSPQLIIALQLNQEEENAVVPRIKQAANKPHNSLVTYIKGACRFMRDWKGSVLKASRSEACVSLSALWRRFCAAKHHRCSLYVSSMHRKDRGRFCRDISATYRSLLRFSV